MKTKLFTLFLALVVSVGTLFAFSGTCGDNLTWDLTDGVLTISGSGDMTNWERNLDVPWHYFLENITRVTVPNSVTSIGDYAFYSCSRLTSITIPNSVTRIGKWAFAYCTGLTSITIPNRVKNIGVSPFYGCSGLTSVVWNAKHCHDVLYDYRSPFYDIRSRIISCVFGEEVEHIPAFLCDKMTNLTSIEIPNNVISIGEAVFYECSGLSSVTIGNSVTSIGDYAFGSCSSLMTVTIPNSVTSIGYGAFRSCYGLTSVTVGNSVENIGNYAFADCSGLTNVTLKSNNIVSKAYTFSSNLQSIFGTQVTEYIIGNDVTSIGDYAFGGCSGLTSVSIGNSVTSIGNGAFTSCSSLTSVTIPNSVISIGDLAFYYCSALTSVTIPNSVTSIGDCAFQLCSSLMTVTIPNSVTSIGDGAFNICKGLASVTIPNSVTSIGGDAFDGCSGLTSVTIPNSVTSIGDRAFAYCTGLTSITCEAVVPPTCGYSAFDKVNKSIPLYVPNNSVDAYKSAPQWREFFNIVSYSCGDNLTWDLSDGVLTISGTGAMSDFNWNGAPWYSYRDDITSITIPNSVTRIGDYAFYGCKGLTSVTIPNSVTCIGKWAFAYCTGLTSVTIPNSVTIIGDYAFYLVPDINYSGTATGSPWGARSVNGYLDGFLVYSDNTKTNLLACFAAATGELSIPNSVKSIGNYAFVECSGLTTVTIPNSVTSIGDYAFNGCKGLTSPLYNAHVLAYLPTSYTGAYAIPEGIEQVAGGAFALCDNLTSVTIPNSVTSIGDYAFNGCSGLKSITCNADVPPICGNNTFKNVNKSILLYIPVASMDAYQTADVWRDFTNMHTDMYYNVVFVDWDGTTLKSDLVEHRQSANAPANPSRKGYTFTGWDKDFSNVTSDLTVTAQYTINKYFVRFVDWDDTELKSETVEYGKSATAPANPSREGYTFTGWDKEFTNVQSNLVVKAQYTIQNFMVKFVDWDDTELKSEIVEYGKSATAPANPSRDGYTFIGWDKEFSNVTSDMTVNALYAQSEGIEEIHINTSSTTRKILIDNVIFILRGDEVFNAQGARVK